MRALIGDVVEELDGIVLLLAVSQAQIGALRNRRIQALNPFARRNRVQGKPRFVPGALDLALLEEHFDDGAVGKLVVSLELSSGGTRVGDDVAEGILILQSRVPVAHAAVERVVRGDTTFHI